MVLAALLTATATAAELALPPTTPEHTVRAVAAVAVVMAVLWYTYTRQV
jgi:hypothetical protein